MLYIKSKVARAADTFDTELCEYVNGVFIALTNVKRRLAIDAKSFGVLRPIREHRLHDFTHEFKGL